VDATLLALIEGAAPDGVYFEARCRAASRPELEKMAEELEAYRRSATNFYHRVRSIFFLEALHRYFLPPHYPADTSGTIPFAGHQHGLARRYEEAIGVFLQHQRTHGSSDALSSALASAYHGLAFKTLAQQVQKTVRTVRGNQWTFRMGHPLDYPLKLSRELLERVQPEDPAPVLFEETAVRKNILKEARLKELLPQLADRMDAAEPFTADTAEAALRALAEESAVKAGLFINASRTMLTGQAVGPSMFDVFEIMGPERSVMRLRSQRPWHEFNRPA